MAVEIKTPSKATLKKYGLSAEEWWEILKSQNYICMICEKTPSTGRFVTDHEHVKGYKKLPPEVRKLYVRGILCHFCNHYYLARCINIKKSQNVTNYLTRYVERRPQDKEKK